MKNGLRAYGWVHASQRVSVLKLMKRNQQKLAKCLVQWDQIGRIYIFFISN
jgi:hypothetical protein